MLMRHLCSGNNTSSIIDIKTVQQSLYISDVPASTSTCIQLSENINLVTYRKQTGTNLFCKLVYVSNNQMTLGSEKTIENVYCAASNIKQISTNKFLIISSIFDASFTNNGCFSARILTFENNDITIGASTKAIAGGSNYFDFTKTNKNQDNQFLLSYQAHWEDIRGKLCLINIDNDIITFGTPIFYTITNYTLGATVLMSYSENRIIAFNRLDRISPYQIGFGYTYIIDIINNTINVTCENNNISNYTSSNLFLTQIDDKAIALYQPYKTSPVEGRAAVLTIGTSTITASNCDNFADNIYNFHCFIYNDIVYIRYCDANDNYKGKIKTATITTNNNLTYSDASTIADWLGDVGSDNITSNNQIIVTYCDYLSTPVNRPKAILIG